MHVNPNFEKLPGSYLFAEIARRVKEFQAANPGADIIKLGIGDVTRPLAPVTPMDATVHRPCRRA